MGDKKLAGRIRFWLQVMQTSSPSYPVMISLDLTRRQVAFSGKTLFSRSWRWARRFRHELREKGVIIFQLPEENGFALDLCRTTLLCPQGEGRWLAKRLADKYRFQVELYNKGSLLAIVGPAQLSFSPADLARFFAKARDEVRMLYSGAAGANYQGKTFPPSFFKGARNTSSGEGQREFFSPFSLTPREALYSSLRAVPLESSPGEICGEMVVLSPPGIPLLSPGELITAETVRHLLKKRAERALFQGAADPSLKTIKIVTEAGKNMIELT